MSFIQILILENVILIVENVSLIVKNNFNKMFYVFVFFPKFARNCKP